MENQNIVVLTGKDRRHDFFIQHLNFNFEISKIYLEETDYPCPLPQSKDESIAWNWFFKQRDIWEERTFKQSQHLTKQNNPEIFHFKSSELNSSDLINNIEKVSPDFIAIFGTGILNENFLDRFQGRLFNLHIGDPEYYRGSSCNFWPIFHHQFQYLSATIHRIDSGIDTGDVLFKQTAIVNRYDNEQSLLIKPLILGTKLMVKAITEWKSKSPLPQKKRGRLYKRSDFKPGILLQFKQMVESGKMEKAIHTFITGKSTLSTSRYCD